MARLSQVFTGKDAVVNGNIIRGFLVHNGIFIQGRAWRELKT